MPIHEDMQKALEAYLGHHNAINAIKTFSQRTVGKTPETLTPEDVPHLLDALRPMLNTLVGQDTARRILDEIRRKVLG